MIQYIYNYFSTGSGFVYLQNISFFVLLIMFSAVLTNICRHHIRIMDYASERSSHRGEVPRTGGIAIVLTYCAGIISYYFFHRSYFIEQSAFWGLFLSSLIIAIVSFYDDVTNRAFIFKLLSQFIGVAILIAFGLTLNEWTVPFIGKVSFGPFRYILTVLWVIGITNAFNFMDGLNGLAGGVAVIAFTAFSMVTYFIGAGISFHISYIIAASCIGFIFFNYPKASVFMGDIGSTFLGFSLGAIAILAAHYDRHHTPFIVIPILMANFIMETLYTFIWRLWKGEKVVQAHKKHPYQLLNQMGVSAKEVTLIYYCQSLVLVILCSLYLISPFPIMMGILAAIFALYTIYFFAVHKAAKARGIIS